MYKDMQARMGFSIRYISTMYLSAGVEPRRTAKRQRVQTLFTNVPHIYSPFKKKGGCITCTGL